MKGELIMTEYVEPRRFCHVLHDSDLLVNQDLTGVSGQTYVKLVTVK